MKVFYLLFAVVLTGITGVKAQTEEVSRITLSGEGSVYVVPDRADLYFGIRTEGDDVIAVKKENDALVAGLLKALAAMGIDQKNVRTQRLDLQKNYDHREKKETWNATQNFVLRIEDLKNYEAINTMLLTSGVNRIEQITFGHSDQKALEDRARKAAVADAMAKVKLYSEALGRAPGDLILLEEEGQHPPAPVYRMAMAESDSGGGPSLAAGEIRVSSRIRVVYALK